MKATFKVGDSTRIFSTAIVKPFEVQSFTSEVPIIETGCLAQLPQLPAVITYRKADDELISVEFVPAFFKLN
jgi:hypothetical protein